MDPKPLIADILIGKEVRDCLVLASHPDERRSPDGQKPSLTRPTIVMHFDGRNFRGVTSLPVALRRGWSSDNGTGYCTSIRGKQCYVHDGKQWQSETFSEQDEDVMRIGGLSGTDAPRDLVWISTDGALFLRREARWTRHAPPEPARRVFGVHGPTSEELYVCTDAGLLMWTEVAGFRSLIDRPRGIQKEILVKDGDIFVGNRQLMRWNQSGGWRNVEPAVRDVTAIVEASGVVLVGTFEKGVFEQQGGVFVPATPEFQCLEVQRVGSGAFAAADDRGYVRLGSHWHELHMPRCVPGQVPPS